MRDILKLALIGKSGAGKSAVAGILSSDFGFNHLKTGLVCRQISRLLFGEDSKTSTQRLDDLLTTLDPSIFLKATLRGARLDRAVVIDSLRFVSDIEVATTLGCRTLRVLAPDEARYTRLSSRGQVYVEGNFLHRSETELDAVDTDYVISNSGSLGELRGQISRVLRL